MPKETLLTVGLIPPYIEKAMLKLLLEQRLGWRWELDSVKEYLNLLPRPLVLQLIHESKTDQGQFNYLFWQLPQHIYKVWQSLLELYDRQSLNPHIEVLEYNTVPGAATLGLIELYKRYAKLHTGQAFSLDITLRADAEEKLEFITKLAMELQPKLPENLAIKLNTCAQNSPSDYEQYNLMVLSDQKVSAAEIARLRDRVGSNRTAVIIMEQSSQSKLSSLVPQSAIFELLYAQGLKRSTFTSAPSKYIIV